MVARAPVGGELAGKLLETGLGPGQGVLNGEQPGDNAFDIAVHHRRLAAKGNGRDRGGGVVADPRQGLQASLVVRKTATQFAGHHLSAAVQIARPGVIAKAGPSRHHSVARRRGQGLDGRPAAQEIAKIGCHRHHGGLLQHDFAEPNVIRIGQGRARRGAPRQPPGMGIVPSQQQIAGRLARMCFAGRCSRWEFRC